MTTYTPDDYENAGPNFGPADSLTTAIERYREAQHAANELRADACLKAVKGHSDPSEQPDILDKAWKVGAVSKVVEGALDDAAANAVNAIVRIGAIDADAWFPILAKLYIIEFGDKYLMYNFKGDLLYRSYRHPGRNIPRVTALYESLSSKFKNTGYDTNHTIFAELYRDLFYFDGTIEAVRKIKDNARPEFLRCFKGHDIHRWGALKQFYKDVFTLWNRKNNRQTLGLAYEYVVQHWESLRLTGEEMAETAAVLDDILAYVFKKERGYSTAVVRYKENVMAKPGEFEINFGGSKKASSTRNPKRRPSTARAQAKPASAPAKRRRQSKAT